MSNSRISMCLIMCRAWLARLDEDHAPVRSLMEEVDAILAEIDIPDALPISSDDTVPLDLPSRTDIVRQGMADGIPLHQI